MFILHYIADVCVMFAILIFAGIPMASAILVAFFGAWVYSEIVETREYKALGEDK